MHVRGQLYHTRRLYEHYNTIGAEVSKRVLVLVERGTPPDVLIMHSPEMQEPLYEFYALLGLARISLDELLNCLRPLFGKGSLPRSIKDVVCGTTNCPVYKQLASEPFLDRLIGLGDCLFHHKTFATAEVTTAVREGAAEDALEQVSNIWSRPVATVLPGSCRQADGRQHSATRSDLRVRQRW